MTIAAHATMIECLQFNSDGTKALSRSNDGTLKFWDLSNGGCLHTLDRQILDINCLQFNPDGTQMLAGSIDGTLKLWDFGALPEERLSSLARDCISTPDKVNEAFSFLTPHAQNGVCYQLFKNQKASTSLPPHEYGRLSFLREQGFHASDQERAQAVNHYNATQVALPEIRTVLRKAILQSTSPNASLLSASAIRRITALPDPIRYVVYAKLEEIHRREKKIPQPCPSNYGELTFANNATDQERITAIIEAIELLNVSYSEPRRT